ncbi:MAG: enolase C-terminal domain-like protein [Spirochaetota bacterium]
MKFGSETLTEVICARVALTVETSTGKVVTGWGETPLSVQWVWPSSLSYAEREQALIAFTRELVDAWANFDAGGHPFEVGHRFLRDELAKLRSAFNENQRPGIEALPELAGLVCCSPFDLALHDAYGQAAGRPIYELYGSDYLGEDLSTYFDDEAFAGLYPADFLQPPGGTKIPAWHLVGGKDLVNDHERTGSEPDDGYPVVLTDWIERDGLQCLKIKLRGNDAEWDYHRLVEVGSIGASRGVTALTADFNCQVTVPSYVTDVLDRVRAAEPGIYEMMLYVEQPFPHDLERFPIDVYSVSRKKPLFMDESAHDWKLVRRGYELGWTGVALKTCKTQTGALLSLCWARKHGMQIMVQDLTNPMLAQVSHLQLGYYSGTIKGVETNSMQFYPEASAPEAVVHPGMFRRENGMVDLGSALGRPGFGYRLDEISRSLPEPIAVAGTQNETRSN